MTTAAPAPSTGVGIGLAPWAADPQRSRGRRFAEAAAPPRNDHQRDRDRIVHSTAFRRLVYKTQVFVNHEGDHFRTRLTHSLEVAQVSRAAARALRLNEDLAEAIALAHDLGHTPFGHAGQDALHECMAGHGGFEHNLQSLRVVDRLEQRYFAFDGLNLTFESREGILKHCSATHARELVAQEATHPAARFLAPRAQPSLEAQIVNLADEITYSTHDIDDGLRSGLLTLPQVLELPLIAECRRAALLRAPGGEPGPDERRVVFETLRILLSTLIDDLVRTTAAAAQAAALADIDAVRSAATALARFSTGLGEQLQQVKQFLFRTLYRHPQVLATTTRARQVVHELFAIYRERPSEMPDGRTPQGAPRAVADYIAGMTDRYALREHRRLTGARLL